ALPRLSRLRASSRHGATLFSPIGHAAVTQKPTRERGGYELSRTLHTTLAEVQHHTPRQGAKTGSRCRRHVAEGVVWRGMLKSMLICRNEGHFCNPLELSM